MRRVKVLYTKFGNIDKFGKSYITMQKALEIKQNRNGEEFRNRILVFENGYVKVFIGLHSMVYKNYNYDNLKILLESIYYRIAYEFNKDKDVIIKLVNLYNEFFKVVKNDFKKSLEIVKEMFNSYSNNDNKLLKNVFVSIIDRVSIKIRNLIVNELKNSDVYDLLIESIKDGNEDFEFDEDLNYLSFNVSLFKDEFDFNVEIHHKEYFWDSFFFQYF